MTKIKIIGVLIFALSILLAILSAYISNQNKINNNLLQTINTQKSFTQEISKTIFYIYKNKNSSNKELDILIKRFVSIMNSDNKEITDISYEKIMLQNKKIVSIWNDFYLSVQNFRDNSKITTAYSSIILEKNVNDIYNKNLMLVLELDNYLKIHQEHLDGKINIYKNMQYILFLLLVLLLIYLFTQVKVVISFIQKFLNTSEKIISHSSIKELEHIEVNNNSTEIQEATNNFNTIVDNINNSINISTTYINNSCESLEMLEKNIEDLLELISAMENNNELDKDLTKKEDAIIQSLEELSSSAQNLKTLKLNLDNIMGTSKNPII